MGRRPWGAQGRPAEGMGVRWWRCCGGSGRWPNSRAGEEAEGAAAGVAAHQREHGGLAAGVPEGVMEVSAAQIDRLLAPEAQAGHHGRCGTKPGGLLKTDPDPDRQLGHYPPGVPGGGYGGTAVAAWRGTSSGA